MLNLFARILLVLFMAVVLAAGAALVHRAMDEATAPGFDGPGNPNVKYDI